MNLPAALLKKSDFFNSFAQVRRDWKIALEDDKFINSTYTDEPKLAGVNLDDLDI